MIRRLLFLFALFCILFFPAVAPAARHRKGHCDVCGDRLSSRYYTLDDKKLCSRECIQELLPRCAACNTPCETSLERTTACGSVILCKNCARLPVCMICPLPGRKRPPENYLLCDSCASTCIKSPAEAQLLYDRVCSETDALLGGNVTCRPALNLVHKNAQFASGSKTKELGHFYNRSLITTDSRTGMETLTESSCRIDLRSDLPMALFIDTVAHEAAHNWAHHNLPKLSENLTLSEGFAEYIASCVDLRFGISWMARVKDENPDAVYGNGFRAWKSCAGEPAPDKKIPTNLFMRYR